VLTGVPVEITPAQPGESLTVTPRVF
jgi:hypothetical protein